MVGSRMCGLLAAHEVQNDHDHFRGDALYTLFAGRLPEAGDLAGQPTLSRFENSNVTRSLLRREEWSLDQFVDSFGDSPQQRVIEAFCHCNLSSRWYFSCQRALRGNVGWSEGGAQGGGLGNSSGVGVAACRAVCSNSHGNRSMTRTNASCRLCNKGLTTRDIQEIVKELYGVEVSA
jgi:hypothetical protein